MNEYLVCDSSGSLHIVKANEFGIEDSCYAVFTVDHEVIAIFKSPVFVKKDGNGSDETGKEIKDIVEQIADD
jgi:hypothetical protein